MRQARTSGLFFDEAPEGRALIAQMAEYPFLGQDGEHDLASDLWRLRALIESVREASAEADDDEIAREYQRQAQQLQTEYIKKRDTFFYANIKLVLDIVFPMSRMEHMDMFQFGCLGLMRAIDKFEPDRNVRFSTYATRWIRQAIQRGCDNEESLITIPVHIRDLIKRARRMGIQDANSPDMFDAFCKTLGVSPKKLNHIQTIHALPTSLDSEHISRGIPVHESIPSPLPTPIECVLMEDERNEVIAFIRQCLNALEGYINEEGVMPYVIHAQVIRLRYRIGELYDSHVPPKRTLKEIGECLDMSDDHARHLYRVGVQWIAAQFKGAFLAMIEE